MTPKFDAFCSTFTEHYDRRKLSNMFLDKLNDLPKTNIPNVDEWMRKEFIYLADRAQTGHVDPAMWTRPQPPIYRKDYKKYHEEYDNAARYIQYIVSEYIEKSSSKSI